MVCSNRIMTFTGVFTGGISTQNFHLVESVSAITLKMKDETRRRRSSLVDDNPMDPNQ